MAFFQIFKKSQGRYTRSLSFVAAVGISAIGAYRLSEFLSSYAGPYVRFGVPTALVLAIAVLTFWLVNRPASADFLIATEGEMKKVSWSSRKEIVGSTKVVIVTTFTMAALLYGVDLFFVFVFSRIGLMG